MAKSATSILLSECGIGKKIRVVDIDGGREVRSRLCAMGLMAGVTAEVLSANAGPIVLGIFGGRLAIGYGMASKVRVREVS